MATVTWILKDRDGLERDYQHFGCPLLLSVDEVFHKIRNLKYRYMKEGTLFPEEVDQYDPYIIGSGIRKMFLIQKKRYFPLPEYSDLTLEDILLLDRVQKRKPLTDGQVKHLKSLRLIEGRKPNFHISAQMADHSGERAQYIRNRAFDDQHYKQLIVEYLEKFGTAKRVDINRLLLDKLPDVLDATQKDNKVENLLQALKQEGLIAPEGKSWRMSKKS